MQYRSIAAGETAFCPDRTQLPVLPQQPALGLVALVAEGQAVVSCQVVWCCGASVPFQIRRGGDDNALVIGQAQAHDLRVVQFAQAYGAIVALFDQVDQAIGQVQGDRDVRVSGGELGQQGSNMPA